MKTFLIALAFLIIGAIIGGVLTLGYGAGIGAASGLVIGSQAGICASMKTAREQGVLSAAQIDGIIGVTIERMRAKTSGAPDSAEIEWVGNEADCAAMIAKLEAGPGAVTE